MKRKHKAFYWVGEGYREGKGRGAAREQSLDYAPELYYFISNLLCPQLQLDLGKTILAS